MTPEDRSVLAGELALGVLEGEERAAALRLVIADRDFAREVDRWRAHLATLFREWPEAAVGEALEARVLDAADPRPAGGAEPVTLVRRWRAAAAAASAIAAGLFGLLLLRPDPAPPVSQPIPAAAPAPLVAVLSPAEGTAPRGAKPVAAVFEPGTGLVRLAGAIDVPARRAAELWAIGGDGVPRSLGVLSEGAGPRLTVASDRRGQLTRDVVLAISIEPPGGSPSGSPTGPVVAAGPLSAV
ncbi:MAG TPA: anti-sigma factor [Sphingomonas sp.]|jgi:anti-sigma-K factor RskA